MSDLFHKDVSDKFLDRIFLVMKAYVQVVIQAADWMTQMSPENARELAFNLLGAADAAESDSFLVWFLQDKLAVDDMRAVVSILVDFREYREKRANANM